MHLRLLTRWQNSAGERVRIALHLKGVPFDYVPVSSVPPGGWRRLNPQGLMPTLIVDGHSLAQSGAILDFLEETGPDPPVLPEDKPLHREETRPLAAVIASDLPPINNNRVRRQLAERLGADEAAVRCWYAHWVRLAFEPVEAARPEPWPFCLGGAPGCAAAHPVPQMATARRFGCDLAPYPLLCGVGGRCQELDVFRRARPEAQPNFPGASAPSTPPNTNGRLSI